MAKRIKTKEEISQCLLNKGLIILGEIKTTNDKVHCRTKDGYDVLALPSNILWRNDTPEPFSKYNPYTISNIKTWLKINNVNLELVSDTYVSSTAKLKWKCGDCGSIFETPWSFVLGGKRSCNYCSHSKHFDGFRDYYNIIKAECEKYDYELLSTEINRFTDNFEYICNRHKEHGVQHSTYEWMIRGGRHCRYCGIERRGIKKRLDESEIKKIVEEKGYVYCGVEYGSYRSPTRKKVTVLVKCKQHENKGVQAMSLDSIKAGNGRCKYCCGREKTKDDLQQEIDNIGSNLSVVKYKTYDQPILVKCNNCEHEWYTKGVYLHCGVGCPNCHKSNFEKEVQMILDNNDIAYIQQFKFRDCRDKNPLPFDFYLKDLNILIEVDGEGHYKPIRRSRSMSDDDAIKQLETIKYHDSIKTQYCVDNNIKLIRIPYWERNNIEKYLLREIK